MAARKQFLGNLTVDPELELLIVKSRVHRVSEAELHEQRVSFAFGNALENEAITKDSILAASQNMRLISV